MNMTPVTFASTRQSNVDNNRLNTVQRDFNSAFKSVDQGFNSGSKVQSLIDTGRKESERQLRSDIMRRDADPAPVSLARQSSWVQTGSIGLEPYAARRDALNDSASRATMDRASRRDDQFRSDAPRSTDDGVRPVMLQSTSNVTPAILQNLGSIGANTGHGGLFLYEGEEASVDTIHNALNNRFPNGNITAADLTHIFNVRPDRAAAFLDRHHTLGDPANMSVDALMRHVSRWQDENGNLTQSRFEAAIVNGASHINVNRFEHEETKGFEFRGFKEMSRRANVDLPDEALATIYNRFKALDFKGQDDIAERSELVAMGIKPDIAGDVPVAEIRKALDLLAFGEPASPPPQLHDPVYHGPSLPRAQQTSVVTHQPVNGTGNWQQISFPPGNSHNVVNQSGNIQNFFNGLGSSGWNFHNHHGSNWPSNVNNVWRNGNNNFQNRWP